VRGKLASPVRRGPTEKCRDAIGNSPAAYPTLKASGASRDSSLSQHWQSDHKLETLIAELEDLTTRPVGKRKREIGPIDQVLGDIIELCYADARALAEPNRMAALEL
jgi:hypothetical protein